MDLKIAWWNCHLSAPATAAAPRDEHPEFGALILTMLDSGVDLLCLCEVNTENCEFLQRIIYSAALSDPKYSQYQVQSLYKKEGNKIDDYGVIYRKDKLKLINDGVELNTYSDVTEKYLKVGRKLEFLLNDELQLWVILCHWQSLRAYHEDSHIRTEVGSELRGCVKDIFTLDPNALIAICGDFNDEPFSKSIQMSLKASRDISYVRDRSNALFNPFWRLIGMTDLVTGIHLPAGTCSTKDAQHMTYWRTFDQIILSSGFLRNGWSFVGSGVEIMSTFNIAGSTLNLSDLSDHYPIACSLKRNI